MLQYASNSDEVWLSFIPLVMLLFNVVVVTIIMDAIGKVFNVGTEYESVKRTVLSIAFAAYMMLAQLICSGLYVLTMLSDHFGGLRYQLNFTGIRSNAYVLGIFLSDFAIAAFVCVL
jgi:hypothetical protein